MSPKPVLKDIRDSAHAFIAEIAVRSVFGGSSSKHCPGCTPEFQPNQSAHIGGCLSDDSEVDHMEMARDISPYDIIADSRDGVQNGGEHCKWNYCIFFIKRAGPKIDGKTHGCIFVIFRVMINSIIECTLHNHYF